MSVISRLKEGYLLFETINTPGTEGGIARILESSIDYKYDDLVDIGDGNKPNRNMKICRSVNGDLNMVFGKQHPGRVEFAKLYAVVPLQKSTLQQRTTTLLKFSNILSRSR